MTSSTLSNIFVVNSTNITVRSNLISGSESRQGGIYLQSGAGEKVINNTIRNNVYDGLVINTTGSSFENNMFFSNPVDLACNKTSALKYTNSFSGSNCKVNVFCGFAHCTSDVPFNITAMVIYPGAVESCGQISSPGRYTLSTNLTLSKYLNTSNPISKLAACITIASPNVRLDCAGHTIADAGSAIYVTGVFNVSIANCTLSNNTYGLRVQSSFGLNISNIESSRSVYGIGLDNSTSGKFSDVRVMNNTYGLFLNLTDGMIFSSLAARGNEYGIYAQSGGSDVFNGGSMLNNTKADAYCSALTYNSNSDLWQNIDCGVTDCNWATSCKLKTLPILSSYPIDSCRQITYPGKYLLTSNLLSKGSCLSVASDNVLLDCNGYSLLGSDSGTAFQSFGTSNVSIENCKIYQFSTGVNFSSSDHANASSLTISGVGSGVVLDNVESGSVTGVQVLSSSISGFSFIRTRNSIVTNDYTDNGTSIADGFVFSNSSSNWVYSNFAGTNPGAGFKFIDSLENIVLNNSALSNMGYDYYCSPSSSGIYSEPVNINFGVTKGGCKWLVELPQVSQNPPCQAVSSGAHITLTNDMDYQFGNTCFTLYNTATSSANNTLIDCEGHIVFASHGGTFVNVINSSSVTIRDCIIRNFATAIASGGQKTSILNNTIDGSDSAIALNAANYATVEFNNIENSTYGLMASGANFATVRSNLFGNSNTAMNFSGGSSEDIENNTASLGAIGLKLSGTLSSTLHRNTFLGDSLAGIACEGASMNNTSSNQDLGGEVCSGNSSCHWVTSSQCMAS